ncbi:MAG TPA: GNAT family N-acetyltransferase [Holophaga sp.]|nr:GNAT family N-acetyltransferase [Holophaga sp.]
MEIVASTAEERGRLDDGLVAFNQSVVPFRQQEPLVRIDLSAKDEDGNLLGGIIAVAYCWNILYVDILFVEAAHRGQGIGRRLLVEAEERARQMGVRLVHLDTFDWQARGFYESLGYEVFAVLEDCPEGHARYYLKKLLA